MKVAEIEVKINIADREAQYWRNILRDKSCEDCVHWQGGGCQLAEGQIPPPDVQKTGCKAWEWDDIPF